MKNAAYSFLLSQQFIQNVTILGKRKRSLQFEGRGENILFCEWFRFNVDFERNFKPSQALSFTGCFDFGHDGLVEVLVRAQFLEVCGQVVRFSVWD